MAGEGRLDRWIFVLLDRFAMLPLCCALDALQVTNRLLSEPAHDWIVTSRDGHPVTATNGQKIVADSALAETAPDDVIVVCGGESIRSPDEGTTISWLRRQSRQGGRIVAVASAPTLLARAGLLTDRTVTISDTCRAGFREEFPAIDLSTAPYMIQGRIVTVAGGIAMLDLMIALLAEHHGDLLAHSLTRAMGQNQSLIGNWGLNTSVNSSEILRHPKMAAVIQLMEDNTEDPLSLSHLASKVGISTRQLERLFRRYLSLSPKRYYMQIRLDKARNLLRQTDMPVIEIAIACGFQSPSHFARWYKFQYGLSPYRDRFMQQSAPLPRM